MVTVLSQANLPERRLGRGLSPQTERKISFSSPRDCRSPSTPPFVQAVSGFNCVRWQGNAAGHGQVSRRGSHLIHPPSSSTPQTRKPHSWRRAESPATFSLYFHSFVKHAQYTRQHLHVCTNKILKRTKNVNIVYYYIPLWPSGHLSRDVFFFTSVNDNFNTWHDKSIEI